ncbi:hypothetical protein DCM91_03115 [Chitinophaga costaii]|nr:hypothetical protein DCM91_03115 [Chitinophaga costaii]
MIGQGNSNQRTKNVLAQIYGFNNHTAWQWLLLDNFNIMELAAGPMSSHNKLRKRANFLTYY